MTRMISSWQYFMLLEKGRDTDKEACALSDAGVLLDKIEPCCFLYLACGDDTVVWVDQDLAIDDVGIENEQLLQAGKLT